MPKMGMAHKASHPPDVGGHWQDSAHIGSLTLHGMAKYARDAGVFFFPESTEVDDHIADFVNSPYVESVVSAYAVENNRVYWSLEWFKEMRKDAHWAIIGKDYYTARVNSQVESHWEPGMRGAQHGEWNAARLLPEIEKSVHNAVAPLPRALVQVKGPLELYIGEKEQPWQDFYPRVMPWVNEELYHLYGGTPTTLYQKMAKWRMNNVHHNGPNQYGNGWDPESK